MNKRKITNINHLKFKPFDRYGEKIDGWYWHKISFDEIFRQTDNKYTKILNQIRVGKITKSSIKILSDRIGIKCSAGDIKPTRIYPLKRLVNRLNESSMNKLSGQEREFKIQGTTISKDGLRSMMNNDITVDQIKTEIEYLKTKVNCDKKLVLKKGAQVMCVANLDMASRYPIVNGSQGIIVDFTEKD